MTSCPTMHKLFEAPQMTHSTTFGLEDPKKQQEVIADLMREYTKTPIDRIGDYTLWEFKRHYALIANDRSRIAYYMQFKYSNNPVLRQQVVSQVVLWRDQLVKESDGLAKRIFRKHLLPSYQLIATDVLQTPDGKSFWLNRVREALEDKLYVYVTDLNKPSKLTPIATVDEFRDVATGDKTWGDAARYHNIRVVISLKPITTGLTVD